MRIEYTDKTKAILSGAIGAGSFKTTAMFDDIVVIPVEEKK